MPLRTTGHAGACSLLGRPIHALLSQDSLLVQHGCCFFPSPWLLRLLRSSTWGCTTNSIARHRAHASHDRVPTSPDTPPAPQPTHAPASTYTGPQPPTPSRPLHTTPTTLSPHSWPHIAHNPPSSHPPAHVRFARGFALPPQHSAHTRRSDRATLHRHRPHSAATDALSIHLALQPQQVSGTTAHD